VGTLRGFHYQRGKVAEAKTIRCHRGAIYDVIVDLRHESPTYLHHFGVELNEDNRLALHVPKGLGHAYLTLTDGAEAHDQVSTAYTPGAGRGLRFDDPHWAWRGRGLSSTSRRRAPRGRWSARRAGWRPDDSPRHRPGPTGGRAPPDPGRHDRGRLRGPRTRQPDRQLHPRDAPCRCGQPRLVRDVPQDAVLTYADVTLPPSRLIDQLREEQDKLFAA
jgi:hypothetical protein